MLAGVLWMLSNGTNVIAAEPTGFRGIPWAASLGDYPDQFKPIGASKPADLLRSYRRVDEKLAIGSVELEYITYIFFQDQLMGVMLKTMPGSINRRAIVEVFQLQFGAGRQPNRYIERYFWLGGATLVSLDCGAVDSACTGMLTSADMKDRYDAARKRSAEDARKDF